MDAANAIAFRPLTAEAAIESTITARDLKGMLDGGDDIYLVDVREPNEYEIVSIPGATLIPKGEFLSGAALSQLPQDKQIVLHCKSGARSAEVLAELKKRGLQRRSSRRRRSAGLGQPGRPHPPDLLIYRYRRIHFQITITGQ